LLDSRESKKKKSAVVSRIRKSERIVVNITKKEGRSSKKKKLQELNKKLTNLQKKDKEKDTRLRKVMQLLSSRRRVVINLQLAMSHQLKRMRTISPQLENLKTLV